MSPVASQSIDAKRGGTMERRMYMNVKEVSQLEEVKKLHEKKQTVTQTANNLGISKRQVYRISKAYKNEGIEGLISKKVGALGNHRLPQEVIDKALGLILERYGDFGPTLAHEYLTEKHLLELSVGSVRNIMISNEIWISKKKRKKMVYQLRPRRDQEGELIQLDGSPHLWFEGRGPYCNLLSSVDDATSKIMFLKFVKAETVIDYFMFIRAYVEKHGRPGALYPDKHSVFRVNGERGITGDGMTQFGRAMRELDIRLICANTPQAKGRVERRHRDLQDRLIKAMRLANICTIEAANAFLPSFIEDFNRRFERVPKSSVNAHRPLLPMHNLDKIFCLKQSRILSKNLTLQYKNVIYQIITDRQSYALRKAEVVVLETPNGTIAIEYHGKPLTAVPYHQMQARAEVVSSKELPVALEPKEEKRYRPGRRHPWKRGKRGFSRRLPQLTCC